MARYKASNFSKIRQDLPNLFFFPASLWNQKNFSSSCFLIYLAFCGKIVVKHGLLRKKTVAESIHITIQASKYINEN